MQEECKLPYFRFLFLACIFIVSPSGRGSGWSWNRTGDTIPIRNRTHFSGSANSYGMTWTVVDVCTIVCTTMASIFRKPKSPFYFAAFRDATGRRCQRSTKSRNRAEAADTARAWEKLSESGRRGLLTEVAARRVVAEIVEQATGEPLHFATCRSWFEEWLAGKAGSTAPSTLAKYRQVTTDFLTYLGERAELPLTAISQRDVRAFRDSLSAGGRAPSTVNLAVRKTLSVPFAAAHRLGYIPHNPVAAVESLKDSERKEREVFTPKQLQALVNKAEGDWKGAILCGYFTGLRLRDVAELTWQAIDFKAGTLNVRARKTGTILMLPLHPEFEAWLKAQTRGIGNAPVFPELAGKGTGGRHGLSGRFKAIMERARIVAGIGRDGIGAGRQTATLSFHCLRHSFVSALANAGVATDLRQRLAGHADAKSHARYTHHEIENMRAAMAKLPSVGSAK